MAVLNRRRTMWAVALEALEVRVVPARVNPYLQNPASDAMTVMWFTQENASGTLTLNLPGGGTQVYTSTPVLATALAFHPLEVPLLPGGVDPGVPYQHHIRVTGLQAGTTYSYSVTQGTETFTGTFKTIPSKNSSVRFMVFGDPETEPESTGDRVDWRKAFTAGGRLYPVDQTEGYNQNMNIAESRNPDFMAGLGDLVDAGGEQRDWDEFWKHLTGSYSDVGASVPYYGIPGNHDDYGGPGGLGGYGDEGSIRAREKFKTYFESPDNGSGVATFEDRYFRVDYGPITFIGLDVSNGLPNGTSQDTNWLLGPGPGYPDFNPGSTQYAWLEAQLADAQAKSQFTFVGLHHAPYSVGPHGLPAGSGAGFDQQSGQPVRVLTPLFAQYGVDAVFGAHDEMYQHSVVNGINFYEIGTAGDELRSPVTGTDGSSGLATTNPYQTFLAHLDAPEVWNGNQLVSGGKHYGHLEINAYIDSDGFWKTKIESAYAFPLMDTSGNVTGWERRVYNDVVTLTGAEANVAPELDNSGSLALNPILEDSSGGSGISIETILSGRITDANPGSPQGLALTAAQQTHGLWQYTTDAGTNWTNVGNLSTTTALLLASDSSHRLRFIPNADFSGAANVSFVAWDQFTGSDGELADVSARGDSTAYSLNIMTASQLIAAVNDAPAGVDLTLTISEDAVLTFSPANFGFSDPKDIPVNSLLAVKIATLPTAGTLAFNGTAVTAGQFVLASGIAGGLLKFTPTSNASGSPYASFTFQVQDDGGTSNGGIDLDPVPNTITINVTGLNDAPVLNDAGSPTLDSIKQTITNANNVGTLVSTLISRMSPSGGISDVDAAALQGIAVIGLGGTANGKWQFTTNGGSSWTDMGVTGVSTSRLLAANSTTRIRFVPKTNFNGTVSFTFVAWDQTTGANGGIANATVRGGTTAYSTLSDIATITVTKK